jgi:hypothetical protein
MHRGVKPLSQVAIFYLSNSRVGLKKVIAHLQKMFLTEEQDNCEILSGFRTVDFR